MDSDLWDTLCMYSQWTIPVKLGHRKCFTSTTQNVSNVKVGQASSGSGQMILF